MIEMNKSKLRPKPWLVDSGFVVHLEGKLGKKERVFLDKGETSNDRSSI